MSPLSRRSFLTTAAALAAAAATRRLAARSDKPAEGPPMAAGTSEFGVDLYAKLATAKGNVFFSPFSITAALAMTAAGAKGETLAQMRKVLHLPQGQQAAPVWIASFCRASAGLNCRPSRCRP